MLLSRPTQSVYRISPRIPSIPFLPAGMPRLATGGAAATPPGGKGTPPPSPLSGEFRLGSGPLHQQVDAAVVDAAEAQALVEAQRRVQVLDVDAHRLAGRRRLGQQVAQDGAADAVAPMLGQQGDVDDVQRILAPVDVPAP